MRSRVFSAVAINLLQRGSLTLGRGAPELLERGGARHAGRHVLAVDRALGLPQSQRFAEPRQRYELGIVPELDAAPETQPQRQREPRARAEHLWRGFRGDRVRAAGVACRIRRRLHLEWVDHRELPRCRRSCRVAQGWSAPKSRAATAARAGGWAPSAASRSRAPGSCRAAGSTRASRSSRSPTTPVSRSCSTISRSVRPTSMAGC